jgi:hypothetical protein
MPRGQAGDLLRRDGDEYDDLSCARDDTSCELLHVMSSLRVIADGLTYALPPLQTPV